VKFCFSVFLGEKGISEDTTANSQSAFHITEGIFLFFLSLCLSLFYVSSSVGWLPSLARIKPKPGLVSTIGTRNQAKFGTRTPIF
jgi:hypothetical protein